MAESTKYQSQIELLQGTLEMLILQALHRLERRKRVKSEWKLTESKQHAKYCQLTALGKKQLARGHWRWLRLVRAIGAIMEPEVQQ